MANKLERPRGWWEALPFVTMAAGDLQEGGFHPAPPSSWFVFLESSLARAGRKASASGETLRRGVPVSHKLGRLLLVRKESQVEYQEARRPLASLRFRTRLLSDFGGDSSEVRSNHPVHGAFGTYRSETEPYFPSSSTGTADFTLFHGSCEWCCQIRAWVSCLCFPIRNPRGEVPGCDIDHHRSMS